MGGATLNGALDPHHCYTSPWLVVPVVDLQWNAIQSDYGYTGVCFVTHNDLFVCHFYAEIGGERTTECH